MRPITTRGAPLQIHTHNPHNRQTPTLSTQTSMPITAQSQDKRNNHTVRPAAVPPASGRHMEAYPTDQHRGGTTLMQHPQLLRKPHLQHTALTDTEVLMAMARIATITQAAHMAELRRYNRVVQAVMVV